MTKLKLGRPATGLTKTAKLALSLDPEILIMLDNIAAIHERSRANMIECLVKQEARKHETTTR
jgi:hypothetical protein